VTKARILQAVREARGETASQLIEQLKKGEMAERAQESLTGSGGCRSHCARPGLSTQQHLLSSESSEISPDSPAGEESAATGCETAMADSELPEDKFVAAEHSQVAAE
jgi:ParB family chromosome partitioning protein